MGLGVDATGGLDDILYFSGDIYDFSFIFGSQIYVVGVSFHMGLF